MKTTSTTQTSMFTKVLSVLVFISLFSLNSFAHPTTYASIGDFVWVDSNGNGIQDSGEPGVANVTVKLLNASGSVVSTTTTNASGKYTFTNVYVPSCTKFRVQFGTPGQYTWTIKTAPGSTVTNNSNADANGLTDEFTLCAGDNNTCIDAGIRQSTTGKATIGDFVFVDQNANGRQDAGEPGVANVTVKLLNAAGAVVATSTTNASGIYFFTDVPVSACGQYKVQFGTPGQYTWTTKTAAGSTVTNNSNADANGLTDAFTVCPGDYNTCIDAGILQSTSGKATVGDFVFVDQNANGRQDNGEPGVPNVTVKLLNAAGTVVATATTNSSGIYFFSNFSISACGQYKVQFGTPGQFTFTAKQAPGSTATNNSNADANGLTDAFTVCPGDYNTCIDAGILPSGGPLPVTLSHFQGNYTDGVSKLSWTSGFETAKTTYEVERSADGVSFKNISTVNNKGISSGSAYSFNDNLPLNGNNYYRLKIYDGALNQYSNIIVLNAEIKGFGVKVISANPFVNLVKINVVSENPASIRVIFTDHLGRILKSQSVQGQKGSNEISLTDLGNLTNGIYNIEVITAGQTKSIKLMKN